MIKNYIIKKFIDFVSESNKENYEDDEVKNKGDIMDQFVSITEDPSILDSIKSILSKKSLVYCQGYLDGWIQGTIDMEEKLEDDESEDNTIESNEKSNSMEYNDGFKDGISKKNSIS